MRVGSRTCALPVRYAVETMRPLPIERLGPASPAVLGVAMIRGSSVPVVDVAAFFGERVDATRFVTIRIGEPARVVALAVDQVIGVRDMPSTAWQSLPGLLTASNTHIVHAIATADADLVLALDAGKLVPEVTAPQ